MDKRINNGGKATGGGRKPKTDKMENITFRIPPDDKKQIKAKHGKKLSGLFRKWVRKLLR